MSEFWKKRRPKLSEDEERALWERVRTMPTSGAARARSPWAVLWARPAVRFGAPVLAVALVAIVWVAQREPEVPRRLESVGTMRAPDADAPVAGNSAPASEVERAPATTLPAEPSDAGGALGELRRRDASPSRERADDARDEAVTVKEEAQTFAAPPTAPVPAPGVTERKAEGTRAMAKAGPAEAPKPTKVTVIKGARDTQAYKASGETSADLAAPETRRSSEDALYLIEPNRIADVLHLAPGETVFEQVRLPLSGGLAWIVAGRGLEGTLRLVPFEGGNSELVHYAWPEQRNSESGMREAQVHARGGIGVGILVMYSGRGFRAQFRRPDGSLQSFTAPRSTLRARRAVLGVELLLSLSRHAAVLGVRAEAVKLATQNPDDEGTRALVIWCDSMVDATRPRERD